MPLPKLGRAPSICLCYLVVVALPGVIAGMIGGWELVLALAVLLLLWGAKHLPDIAEGLGKGMADRADSRFKKPVPSLIKELENDPRFHQPDLRGEIKPMNKSASDGIVLWLAQGFGVGRIPVAPGTFGSVVGLLWFFLLLAGGSLWLFAAGVVFSIPLSVWCCGEAEKILQKKDPGSVVLDEIIAMPICFLGWVLTLYSTTSRLPAPAYFLSSEMWPYTFGVFAAFRFFDVLKPWPVKQSQSLPGGYGVTIDDVLAAVYVNLVVLAASFLHAGGG